MRDGKDDDEEEQEGERERWDDCVWDLPPPGDVRVTLGGGGGGGGGRAASAFAEEKVGHIF